MPTTANISNDEVFAYAEANYRSIFTGAAISGTYQQYAYRYYAASGNYLGIDTSGGIAMLGPFTNNVLTEVGPVAAFATAISTWESSMGMGTISASGEVDSVPCTMVAGHHYRIQVQSTSGSLLDPEIARVLDPSQNTLANVSNADYGISQNAQVTFAPAVSGAYNVCVQGQYSTTGGYIVLVTDLDAATNSDTQTTIAAGQTYSDTVGSSFGTKTVFFSLTGGQEYQFTLQTATSGDALNTPVLRGVYDGAGKQLSGSFGQASGGALTVGITPSSTGTYYAVIADSYNDTGGFSFAFNAVAVAKSGPTYAVAEPITRTADDYAATSATSGRLIAGSSVSGNIETADDYDWFAIPLTAGSTYTFDLEGSATAQGTLADPLLGLHNSSGTVVARDDDNGTGLNARITYTPTSSDTYYLDATAASTTATGTYRLWATSSTATTTNDIAGSTATTETVSVGDYINGTIDNTADVDWYGVSLTAGNAYTIRLQGSSSNNGTLGDPLISGIYNSSGTVISNSYADDQDGSDSRLTFTPSTSDTYFIAAEGYGSSTGTFRLTVEGQNSTEISASITTTGIVIVNSSVTGTIDTGGDQDWFAVRLYANTRYQVDLQGLPTSSGTLSDPCLRGIYNSTGTLVSGTTDDDSGTGANALVSFTPTSAGTYYISAGAYSGTTGTYTLAVTSQGGADTPADSTTTATVSPGGSVDGLVDQTGDSDWFAVSLTAGLTYTIDLQPKSNSTSPLNDPYLYGLYNSAGNLISGTTDDDSGAGTGAQVTCAISTSGIYYISAGGYSNNVGNYALSVSSGTSGNSGGSSGGTTTTDLAATTATTGTAIVGASASSSINSANDQDWFSVNLLAGHSYGISLSGADSNGGTLTDPFLRGIYDSSGTPIPGTTDDDSGYGNDALVNFTPTSTGTYFISAGAFSSATGSYALTVSENTIAAPTPTPTPTTPGTRGSWTVMVYVDGDNDLEPFALSDVNEIEAASLPQNIRVSALVDRTPGESSADGNWTDTRYGLISSDTNLNHISSDLTSWGERNMGDPATLTEFINAAALAAPADNYALVIWNHGGGIRGVAWDDSSNSANLSLNEVSQAIAASNVTSFGMIGFDACLQGVLDQAYALRNQTNYLVVSEDTEPGDGWDYTNWLSIFQQSTPSALQVATQAVNSFESFYRAQGNNQVTLSVVDTVQVGGVATAWSSFAQAVTTAGRSAIQTLHSSSSSALSFQDNTYVDLRSLMSNFMQLNAVANLDTSAQNVLTALSSAVVETGGLTTASGLTVYLPDSSHNGYLNSSEFPVVDLTGVSDFYSAYWA